jgi:hypothetical protein
MMTLDYTIECYLEEFEQQLRPLPQQERLDALQTIRGHCCEAVMAGEATTLILARLGSPEALAHNYGAIPRSDAASPAMTAPPQQTLYSIYQVHHHHGNVASSDGVNMAAKPRSNRGW